MPITRHLEGSAVSDLINHPLQEAARQEQARRGGHLARQEVIDATLSDLAEWYQYRFPDMVADEHLEHVRERLQGMGKVQY